MDPFIQKTTFTTYRGYKNLDFYSRTNPIGGGLYYNINKDWSIYGGVNKIGKNFKKVSSYGPEVGFSYHPSCKIF